MSNFNLKNFLDEWDTKRGLLYHIHLLIISLSITKGLLLIGVISPFVAKYIIFLPNIILFISWIIKRSYFALAFSKKLNVVFALDLENKNKNTLKIYRETIENLKRIIIERSLEDVIKIYEKPKDIRFESKKAAEAKTELGLLGSVLLIWGGVIEKSKKYKLFFSYEFGYPGKEVEYFKAIFNKKVDKALAQRAWSFKGSECIELMSEDFLQVAIFIFGLTMASFGNFEKSVILFNELIKQWSNETNLVKKRNLGPAISEAEGILIRIYLFYTEKYRFENKYEDMKIYAEKILEINYDDKSNYSAWLVMAIYYEEGLGDVKKAKECNQKAANIHPPKENLHVFNEAYFSIIDYNFSYALDCYDKLSLWPHRTNFNLVRGSLFKKYKKTKNLGFLFAEIYIAWTFQGDIAYGKKKLRGFIKKAEKSKNGVDYSLLISKAKEILSVKIS